jgi:hypothetical protein
LQTSTPTKHSLAAAPFDLSRRAAALAMFGVFLINLALRVFYTRYLFVNGDEAIRALTALRVLDGGRLYVDVMTDKPPGATLFYLAVLAVFKHSMAAVHIAAALWVFATAVALYCIARRFYSRWTAVWASLLLVYFSTNYFMQDMMAANTELLMVLPYTMAFYAWLGSKPEGESPAGLLASNTEGQPILWLFAAGFLSGISVLFKQIGILNLVFFVSYELFSGVAGGRRAPDLSKCIRAEVGAASRFGPLRWSALRISALIAGSVAPILLTILWLIHTGALAGFWRNAVVLEAFYIGSLPMKMWLRFMLLRTGGYVLFNLALWLPATLALLDSWMQFKPARAKSPGVPGNAAAANRASFNLAIGMWGLVSLLGVFASGRFYGHYFIPVLPALALLAARGIELLRKAASRDETRKRARVAIAVLIVLMAFGLVRFHTTTALLAYAGVTGRVPHHIADSGIEKREKESAVVADWVRRETGEGAPIYIWGYALDVYWRSGCPPASRFLTPYYVSGHFYPEVVSNPEAQTSQFWKDARAQFLDDLRHTKPRIILNVDESIQSLPFPEIVRFINDNYRRDGTMGPDPSHQFIVYKLRGDH